jgi:hypothetical protein
MSYELANATESLGQFASNRGYGELIAAAGDYGALEDFFATGETKDVESCIAELTALAGAVTDPSVQFTAAGLAGLMRRQEVAIITDGLVAPEDKTIVAMNDLGPGRAARGVEKCLALDEIVGALDRGRDEVAAALRGARARVQSEIIHRLLNKPVRGMHQASVPADAKLIADVEAVLRGVAEFGRKQVGEERARQIGGAAPADAAAIRMADARGGDPVGLYADGVVSQWQNTLQARATNAMVARRVRRDSTPGEVIQGVMEDLDGQSDKWVNGVASRGANEAFAAGRAAGFEDLADEIDHYIYSAMLDFNCCGNCAAADGAEGQEDEIPGTPNPDCDGGDMCRCVTVAVFKGEGPGAGGRARQSASGPGGGMT